MRRFLGPTRASWIVLLRVLGWAGLLLGLLVAGAGEGWGLWAGAVDLGALSGAGAGLVLLLSYRPRLVAPAGAAALGRALAGGALLHFTRGSMAYRRLCHSRTMIVKPRTL
ncbi:DUF3325 family protein [Methylobacterium sp. Leaf456]|uniref:DUF3325 family protein n=1 Tax=Methylobacterium sp. Leaf456 TaxID=1736382 RepID=UPI000B2B433D|nr:DUF3325 family protein [Methylobacterium sp. Leaf456]